MNEVVNRGEIGRLRREVLDKAEIEGEKIVNEAKKEMKLKRKRELSELEKRLDQELKDYKKSEEERAKSELYSREMEIKLKMMQRKRHLIERVIEDSINNLKNLPDEYKKKYYRMMISYAKKELGNSLYFIEVPKGDKDIVKSIIKNVKLLPVKNLTFGIRAYNKDKDISVNLDINAIRGDIKEKVLLKVVDEI